jgi:hypothetical protein
MDNLEQRLEILRCGAGNMQHGLPGDDDCYTAAEVIYAAIAELRRLRGVSEAVRPVEHTAGRTGFLLAGFEMIVGGHTPPREVLAAAKKQYGD